MDWSLTPWLCLLALLLLLLLHLASRLPASFPPGPPSLPLLGSYPFLPGTGAEKFFSDKVCSYGPITGLVAGSYPAVVVNSWPLAKALFAREELSGRMSNYTTDSARTMGGTSLGIVMTDGKRWTSQRNFSVKHLRNFGFGKKDLGVVIEREAAALVQHLLDGGQQVKMEQFTFAVPVLNVLWDMVAGHAFNREDEQLKRVLGLMNFVFSNKIFAIAMCAPWVRFIFPSLTGYTKRLEALKAMQDVIRDEIDEHSKDVDYDNPRDLIDCYLSEMNQGGDPEFHREQLVMVGMDLMSAGSDTTTTTLMWAVLYLTLNPSVQERCYEEMTEHLGDSPATLADTSLLHYCQATIAEIQRISWVAISSLQHRVTKEVTLPTGHVLPEGTLAMTNIKKFLTDPQLWDKPQLFNPDRFLDPSGQFSKPDHFVPLGHGRRVCMGEPLVKAELFVFFTAIVHKIRFSSVPGSEPDPQKYSYGITRVPHPFTVRIHPRGH